ncbi:hypothetical protein D9M68_538460 [compost metagenome]
MKADRPLWRALGSTTGSVRQITRMKSASSAKVHQYLLPVMTQSSPSRTARHEILATSEPALGSDSENAPRNSPRAMRGRYSAFFSGVSAFSAPIRPLPRAIRLPTLIQPRDSCSATRQYS